MKLDFTNINSKLIKKVINKRIMVRGGYNKQVKHGIESKKGYGKK